MASTPGPPNPDADSAASDPASAPEAPLLFARYRVERELGRGGMGRVLLAFDTKLRIHVAMKLVPDEFMADAESAEDLRREVLRGIALTHPAIVRTHTFEQDATGAAIVMEYIDGLTFSEWKEQQPGRCFDTADLLPWLRPLCEVLDYAHREARIVHRDLKPRNIMVSRDGKLKVADFGISATLTDTASRNTSQGRTSGTPAYMSPQQAQGKKPSPLDDVYALGATLYDLLAGKPPFFRGSMHAILMQVIGEAVPTMAERREELESTGKAPIPEVWERTIAACLAKDPAERPQSCGEVFARLQGLVPAAPKTAAPGTCKPVTSVPAEAKALVPLASRSPVVRVAMPLAIQPARSRHRLWLALAVAALVLGLSAWWLMAGKKPAYTGSESLGKITPVKPAQEGGVTPATATKDAPFVNSLGMKFVPVPIAGGPTNGQRVLFSIWATRVQDYSAYAGAKKVDDSWTKQNQDGVPVEREMNHPVVGVSWEDAQGFCQWLTEKEIAEGKLPKGLKYRLPSDEEWSCAVGLPPELGTTPLEKSGKNSVDFPWGSEFPPKQKVGNYADEAFHQKFPKPDADPKVTNQWMEGYDDGYATTSPVGSFPANVYGLYDMGGNVWQWCEDWFYTSHTSRVLRGASWRHGGRDNLLSSHRDRYEPSGRHNNFGVRCVLSTVSTPATTAANTAREPHPPMPTPVSPLPTPTPVAPAATPKPPSEIEKWLAQVDGIYQPMYLKEVVAPFESGMAELKKNTLATLDREIASASRAAKLNDAVAFRNERQRVENDQGVPAEDSDTPPAVLKTLRALYRTQSAQLEADRRKHLATVFGLYDQALATNQTALTQRQRLDEALLLLQRRDALKKEWFAPPPKPGTPAAATKERPFVNTLGMKFVPVPITGGPTSGQRVLFSIWETRVQDYEKYAVTNPKVDGSWKRQEKDSVPVGREPNHPVVGVSWDDAQAFCNWLTEKEAGAGVLPKEMRYRLPTDEEWSFAVQLPHEIGNTPKEKGDNHIKGYPWGDQWPPPDKAGNYPDETFHQKISDWPWLRGYTDGFATTAPVGSFTPNQLEIYDLGGNVWEWCEDWYSPVQKERVLRGGSWCARILGEPGDLLSSTRVGRVPTSQSDNFGFRCVLARSASPAISGINGVEPARAFVPAPAATPVPSPPPHATIAPAIPTPRPASATASRPDAALAKATKDAPFVNSLGMKFVPVPGTKVLFCIWETRVQDYQAYADGNKTNDSWKKLEVNGLPISREPNYPVVAVNWNEAQAFCQWLTQKENTGGTLPSGAKCRLPTDEEWSRAVGLHSEEGSSPAEKSQKDNRNFPWGVDFPPRRKVGNYPDETFHAQFSDDKLPWINGYTDGFATTAPVGSFHPNQFGIYDLGGNVWEWCEDLFKPGDTARVLRGASWHDNHGPVRNQLLSSARWAGSPMMRGASGDIGFRCVVELPGP